jgi:hypothetical protein
VRPNTLIFLFFVACSRDGGESATSRPSASASATAIATASASATASSVPSSVASVAPVHSCEITSPDEKRKLVECVAPLVAPRLGYMGAFTVPVDMDAEGHLVRAGQRMTSEPCKAAEVLLAAHRSCSWDVRGPTPEWTIRVVPPRAHPAN